MQASQILEQGKTILDQRGQEYDKATGERSMARIVAVFNAHHDTQLTEEQGWHFMQIVKDVRFFTKDAYHHDSVVDGVNYLALRGECRAQRQAEQPERMEVPAPISPYLRHGVPIVDCNRTSGIESINKATSIADTTTYVATAVTQTVLNQTE